jgi:hypothetical protein
MRYFHAWLIVLTAFVLVEGVAVAQDVPRYAPQRPTLSPYLNISGTGFGGLPNYYRLVRPEVNQRAFDNRSSRAARSQALAIQSLKNLSSAQTAGATGTGSVYGNLSHFYPRSTRSSR